jgi:hypothetical protein
MQKPSYTDLAAKVGISRSYACEILGDKKPSRPLAIRILRVTGWLHEILDGLTDEQIATLETIEPWQPQSTAA